MIGLVIVTHGRLAEELRAAMEHVVGAQRNVATICIAAEDDVEARRGDVAEAVAQVDAGDGVVLMTDMFGGTPSNLCIAQMDKQTVEVIAGVNLPMLVKLAKVRSILPLRDAVLCAQQAGRKYIASASDVLPNCRMMASSLRSMARPGGAANGTMVGSNRPLGQPPLPPVPVKSAPPLPAKLPHSPGTRAPMAQAKPTRPNGRPGGRHG